MNAIEINGLVKKYPAVTAIDGISLTIKEGEIFGLLGPNGAGKSTTLSILSTITEPTSGNAKVCGKDIKTEKDAVRKCIGIVFQDFSLDDELTARENLELHGMLYGMDDKLAKKRIDEVLKLVELSEKANLLVKTYSGGMKRRLEIARGLIHHPRVLFLDEPTLGLDPQTRRNLWDYIKNISETEKMTVILTTHYMEEADFLCDRIAIIDKGKIIALNTPEKLKDVMGGDIITISVSKPEKLKELIKSLDCMDCVKKTDIFNGSVNVTSKDGAKNLPKIIALAQKNKIEVTSAMVKRPSLEDVFIHYTGRTIRDENASSKDQMRKFRGGH